MTGYNRPLYNTTYYDDPYSRVNVSGRGILDQIQKDVKNIWLTDDLLLLLL